MPDLCLNDCGFYSGANAEGLCSYCFREAFPEKAAEEADKKKKMEKKEETSRRGKRKGRADENKDLENNIKTLTYSTVELDGVVSRVVVIGNNQSPAKQRKAKRTEEEKEAMRSKKKEERKALKSVFTSMLILLTAIYSVFGMIAACVLFNTSVSFFFHTREQRIKRKAEGQGGEDDAVKKEKTATDAVNTQAEDNDKAESKKKTQKARCKVYIRHTAPMSNVPMFFFIQNDSVLSFLGLCQEIGPHWLYMQVGQQFKK